MNVNNPQSSDTRASQDAAASDPVFDALLDRALDAGGVSRDLEKRIIALSDPQMNARLDEALAPGALAEGLERRVHAAVQAANRDAELPVVGHIGSPSRIWHYVAAAAVAIASGLGIYFNPGFSNTADPAHTSHDSAAGIAALEKEFELLAQVLDDDSTVSLDFVGAISGGIPGDINAVATRIQAVGDSFWGGDAGDFQDALWQEVSLEGDGPLVF